MAIPSNTKTANIVSNNTNAVNSDVGESPTLSEHANKPDVVASPTFNYYASLQDPKSRQFQNLLQEHTQVTDERIISKHYAVYGPNVSEALKPTTTPADLIDTLSLHQRTQQKYDWLTAGTMILPNATITTNHAKENLGALGVPAGVLLTNTASTLENTAARATLGTPSALLNRTQSTTVGGSGGSVLLANHQHGTSLGGGGGAGGSASFQTAQLTRTVRLYEEIRQIKTVDEEQIEDLAATVKKKFELCSEKAPLFFVSSAEVTNNNNAGGGDANTTKNTTASIDTLFCMKLETLYEFLENFSLPDVPARWDVACKYNNDVVKMLTSNVYRKLPDIAPCSQRRGSSRARLCRLHGCGEHVELQDFALEEAWPLLRVVYGTFYLYLCRQDFPAAVAAAAAEKIPTNPAQTTTINAELFDRLVRLMARSEDARERDMLLLIVHKIYQLYPTLRPQMRHTVGSLLLQFKYCNDHNKTGLPYDGADNCYGIGEMLQLYACIVKGLRRPMAREYARVLFRVIMPLHKLSCAHLWHEHLAECVKQFLLKEPTVSKKVFKMLLLYWPKVNSFKEMLFIDEIELLLQCLNRRVFNAVAVIVFQRLIACAQSQHFQVALRALRVWQNVRLQPLLQHASKMFLPVIFPTLHRMSQQPHWHPQVGKQAYEILKLTLELNAQLFSDLAVKFKLDCMEQKASDKAKENDKERVKIDALKALLRYAREDPDLARVWSTDEVQQLGQTVAVAEARTQGADDDDILAELEEDFSDAKMWTEQPDDRPNGGGGDDDDEEERWSKTTSDVNNNVNDDDQGDVEDARRTVDVSSSDGGLTFEDET